jgi:hypothetical protein
MSGRGGGGGGGRGAGSATAAAVGKNIAAGSFSAGMAAAAGGGGAGSSGGMSSSSFSGMGYKREEKVRDGDAFYNPGISETFINSSSFCLVSEVVACRIGPFRENSRRLYTNSSRKNSTN